MTAAIQSRRRQRRWAVLLAMGVGFGGPTVMALSGWNADVGQMTVRGELGSSTLRLESSVDGDEWRSHDSLASATEIQFPLRSQNLSPGDVVEAPLALRLAAPATRDADVRVTAFKASGRVDGLSYELSLTESFGCAGGPTRDLVPSGSSFDRTVVSAAVDLVRGDQGQAGLPVNLCLKVTAEPSIRPNQTGAVAWQFTATTKDTSHDRSA